MTTPFTLLTDLAQLVVPPDDGTLSRTIFQDGRLKAVMFGFSAGHELSQHTASTPAIMHFLQGNASITLGSDQHEVGPGTWAHMDANLTHSVRTKSPVLMLLLLLKD